MQLSSWLAMAASDKISSTNNFDLAYGQLQSPVGWPNSYFKNYFPDKKIFTFDKWKIFNGFGRLVNCCWTTEDDFIAADLLHTLNKVLFYHTKQTLKYLEQIDSSTNIDAVVFKRLYTAFTNGFQSSKVHDNIATLHDICHHDWVCDASQMKTNFNFRTSSNL